MSIDLDKARALCDAATEGPWVDGGQGWVFAAALIPDDGESRGMRDLLASVATKPGDSALIAAARTLLPEALDEIEQLRCDLAHEKWNADRLLDQAIEARAERDKAEATLARVRELHYPETDVHGVTVCAHRHCVDDDGDQVAWPCPTARVLDGADR